MDLSAFAADVGDTGPVTIAGRSSRGGAVEGVRAVAAPGGIVELMPEEMIVRCGAGTAVDELSAALTAVGQCVALPGGGTVGGALSVGQSDVYRLGHGPVRDTLLQARYVSAEGRVVKAGGPTVKNVTGFDVCRLLVGSRGTLGFLGEVILRTRPRPAVRRWFRSVHVDPFVMLRTLYRPASILWDGTTTWLALEGHAGDVDAQARTIPGAVEVDGPPALPIGSRRSLSPTALGRQIGPSVAEVGVGIVHHADPWTDRPAPDPVVVDLHERLRRRFDPAGRLNPGVDVLDLAPAASV
jgi:glycolate oxidase FAD binding subunit